MYRVLIVDDEVPFLQSLSMFDWETYGCRCVGHASNGQEAIEKCSMLAPHIVITDINMPVLDGLSLLSEINKRFPEIQVILLTVHRDFEYAQKAVNLGACDYLVKDMDYRRQLPVVLEKAKKPFEQQPVRMNYSANLLHRSGHMMVIESDDALFAYQENVAGFLQKYQGTLITARVHRSYDSLHSLISGLDLFLSTIEENIGLIVRDQNCFELLVRKSIYAAQAWLSGIFTHERLKHIGEDTSFALSSCGDTIARYKEAHNMNILMLERSFYSAQPQIVISRQTFFSLLPTAVVDEWLRKSNAFENSDETAYKIMNEIVKEAEMHTYYPSMVRKAFDRILYKYELRYAASSDKEAHEYILNSPSIKLLADKLLSTIRKIRSKQDNYSYFVLRAREYMLSNIGNPSLQLVDVAEHVGISPGYLSKKLKEETSCTFQELLIAMRMEYASELLRKSDKRVYEIAELVGYENYRSFSLAFTRFYGISPKKYK
ncbi:MAG TPA: response regulator [Clostridiales bacterium]|nr:response regulator [Clostridiales bacterium]